MYAYAYYSTLIFVITLYEIGDISIYRLKKKTKFIDIKLLDEVS